MKNTLSASIIINNYNYGRFLADAIDSAIAQTYPNKEIIVVDDGSTDHSREIIDQYQEQIIPVLKENGGQASAFNAGFAASQGDVIFFLDADDIFTPNKVEETIEAFEKHPEVSWSFHPQEIVDTDKNLLNDSNICLGLSKPYDFRKNMEKGKLNPFLPTWGLPATTALTFRRSLLSQILPMPEMIRITSDDYLKFSALGLSPGFIIEKKLSLQRIHGNNAFTLKKDKQLLQGRINITTAYWLKRNFASLSKFANNTFATGLFFYKSSATKSKDCLEIIDEYLSNLTFLEKLEINLRMFYYQFKA